MAGERGMQYNKKSFTNYSNNTDDLRPSVMSDEDRTRLAEEDKARFNGNAHTNLEVPNKTKKRIIPFGNRFIVKRRRIGEKLGSGLIIASDETKDRPVDIADVVSVPELTFADKAIIDNADEIAKQHGENAANGDNESLKALLEYRVYLQNKSIQVGDTVFLNKYAGVDFADKEGNYLTVCGAEDILGRVKDVEA